MPIITISREMGTGAYNIAKELARKLKYTLVDGQKLVESAATLGLSREMLQAVDEKPPSYNTAEDRERAAILSTIELILLEIAKSGNVILYGRGGQDLLKNCENVLKLRFIADFEERVECFAEREWLDPDLAQELIRRSDHQRGGFIHFYFNRDWNDPLGYDLIFNTSRISSQTIIDAVVAAIKEPRLKQAEELSQIEIENAILVKRIEAALLRSESLEYRPFRISANGGQVTLSGYTGTETDRSSALKVVAAVPGVEELIADIQVINYREYKEKC